MRSLPLTIAVLVVLVVAYGSVTGCAQIAGNVPSLQYCSQVKYERTGADFTIEAKCSMPIGGGSLVPAGVF